MQGQENMYSVLRTRTAVLEHVWRSFARSGVHWPTNPRVIVTLTLLKVILSYRHLINRISRWLKQFKTNSRHNSRPNSRTNCCSRPPGRALLLWRNSRVCSAGRLYTLKVLPRKTSRLSGRGPSSFHSTLMYT